MYFVYIIDFFRRPINLIKKIDFFLVYLNKNKILIKSKKCQAYINPRSEK